MPINLSRNIYLSLSEMKVYFSDYKSCLYPLYSPDVRSMAHTGTLP